ncbi:toprim domain-containing protein [Nocardia wallacei]|nr:toprim domain-containing protein [Nocardia wallacei]
MRDHNEQGRSYEIVTDALTRRVGPPPYPRNPEQWTNYLCPVHEGDGGHHNPSLGVRYDARQGKTIVRCWARCDDEDVLQQIGLRVRDLWDRLPERDDRRRTWQPSKRHAPAQPVQQRSRKSLVDKAIDYARLPPPARRELGEQTGPAETVDTALYRWPDGRVEGAVTRMQTPHQHGYAKGFWQARWTGTDWEHTGFAPIPYRLPELIDAVQRGREIYVCEGEKDVDRAIAAGQVATCNAMGAGKWTHDHAKWLHGAGRVIIVADRDPVGYRHAAKVAETLHGHVGEIRVLQAAAGKDLTDHLDSGHRIEDLAPLPYLDRHFRQPPERDHGPPRQRFTARTR